MTYQPPTLSPDEARWRRRVEERAANEAKRHANYIASLAKPAPPPVEHKRQKPKKPDRPGAKKPKSNIEFRAPTEQEMPRFLDRMHRHDAQRTLYTTYVNGDGRETEAMRRGREMHQAIEAEWEINRLADEARARIRKKLDNDLRLMWFLVGLAVIAAAVALVGWFVRTH